MRWVLTFLRLILQLVEDQDGADKDFWKQDFFAEERADEEYATESESDDEADTDFSGSVRLQSRPASSFWLSNERH